ncbi:MAG: TIGR02221 family CRISPR-associated protein [Deltaproteobacteria bacterium]|nr:TIGR02221 family CRISPR-associated protein [Deltaproteobacteria bacterium]
MKRIFVSFLGMGPDGEGYSELHYQMEGKPESISTEFVQRAEIEFLGSDSFDKIFILCTKESHDYSFHDLRDELNNLCIDRQKIKHVPINNIETIKHAWELFDKINSLINNGDRLVLDLTHGFRSLSIILSAALNFILKSKSKITLEHVFYGQESFSDDNKGYIIDMKDFYIINEWADGVGRLVDNADAGKLAALADSDSNLHFSHLDDETLINSLQDLTGTLKNIKVNRIARKTEAALDVIKSCLADSEGAERELLKLIENKFQPLTAKSSGKYDREYFLLQIRIIEMLIEHKLFMQAFTTMREFIGSIGMIGAPDNYTENMNDNNTADIRPHYADLFIRMIRYSEKKFSVKEKEEDKHFKLKNSIFSQIDRIGMLEEFKTISKKLLNVRDGFDHAWTGKGDKAVEKIGDFKTIADEAVECFGKLVNQLIDHEIIK